MYLKGGVEVLEKTKGANGACVSYSSFLMVLADVSSILGYRDITQKVLKLISGAPDSGAFTGKGHTLDGKTVAPGVAPAAFNLTPQAKVIIGLVVAYAVLWYFS